MKLKYCEIAKGLCVKGIETFSSDDKVFAAYSSHNEEIVDQIYTALESLNTNSGIKWITWEDGLEIENEMVFCEICKSIITSKAILLELSDFNFNVLFEYGYALGLNKKIHPIVNNGFDFINIERFITPLLGIGIGKYNRNKLSDKLLKKEFWLKDNPRTIYSFSENDIISSDNGITVNCLLYLKNSDDPKVSESIENEISKSTIDLIIDDPQEERNGLLWYSKQIKKSLAVIIDLGVSGETDNLNHYLKCAFIAGVAIASGRRVLIMNSKHSKKPSDIISIMSSYNSPKEARNIVSKFLNYHSNSFSVINSYLATLNSDQITRFDQIELGDHIAENDVNQLEIDFIETPDFNLLSRDGYKLVIGRKGTGKSASFIMCKRKNHNPDDLVINKLFNEYNLNDIYDLTLKYSSENDKNKIVSAFWKFILYSIVARAIYDRINSEKREGDYINERNEEFLKLLKKYDFIQEEKTITENLVEIIESINEKGIKKVKEIQKEFYENDILVLIKAIKGYLKRTDLRIILNIDGIDSNLSFQKNYKIISLILFNLHEVCTTLISKCTQNYALNLFIRNDLYESFKDQITQKDKVNKINIKWSNEELLRMIGLRLKSNSIDHLTEILCEEFTIREFTQKMEKFVYPRPRDYIFIFNHLIEIAKSYKRDSINNKIFNEALKYYSLHINESIEAELLSLPYMINFSEFLNIIKHKHNIANKISINIMFDILDEIEFPEEYWNQLLSFLLKIEFIYIYENNSVVKWGDLVDPTSKLKIILKGEPSHIYFEFHPIIVRLLDTHY